MTTKKKTTPPAKRGANHLMVTKETGKSDERKLAEVKLSPTTANSLTATTFLKPSMGEVDLSEAIKVMHEKVGKVNAGDMSDLEATLTAQVASLDAVFNALAGRAAVNLGEYMHAAESYMRLALKAQAQCARTIEVLAAMKNPPVVFAKQANIAHGHQQVNNATSTPAPAHTGKTESKQTELLTEDHHATLDTSGTAAASGADQELETVGAIHRR